MDNVGEVRLKGIPVISLFIERQHIVINRNKAFGKFRENCVASKIGKGIGGEEKSEAID